MLEKTPTPSGPEGEPISLLNRIDALRRKLMSEELDDAILDFTDAIVIFDAELKQQYELSALRATPAWHKIVGSSQQQEQIVSDYVDEITRKIDDFVSSWEVKYDF